MRQGKGGQRVTLEATAAPAAQAQAAHTLTAHPRTAELIKRVGATGIGAVLTQVLYDMVHPQDSVLFCSFAVEMGAPIAAGAPDANTFYAISVALVTSAYYINIELMPKTHNYRKRKIHTIADVQVKSDPPPPEDLRSVQSGKFAPSNINLTIVFADERGAVVDTWAIESTHPEQVRHLVDISRMAAGCIGFPLAKIPGGGGSA
jgi:hypothetical protein